MIREPSSVTGSGRTHRQKTIVYKKSSKRTIVECNTTTSNKDGLKRGSDSINTSKGQPVDKYKSRKRKDVPLNIPKEYKEYTRLFQKETDTTALPKHQP